MESINKELVEAYNKLCIKYNELEKSHTQLQNAYRELLSDVTKLKEQLKDKPTPDNYNYEALLEENKRLNKLNKILELILAGE